jgi:hypothetical protein
MFYEIDVGLLSDAQLCITILLSIFFGALLLGAVRCFTKK